jgi:hypothetical protein
MTLTGSVPREPAATSSMKHLRRDVDLVIDYCFFLTREILES